MVVPRFTLTFASSSHVTAAFVAGLIDLWSSPLRGAVEGVIQFQSGPTLAHARDAMTRAYLANSQAPVLVMIDTDMAFRAAHVASILSLTAHAGVVGGLYDGVMPGENDRVTEAGYFRAGKFEPIDVLVVGGKMRPVHAALAEIIGGYRGSSPGGIRTRDLSLERAAS